MTASGSSPTRCRVGHIGLIGMRQRVDLVGGELLVESRAGGGTHIEAAVPAGDDESAE